MTNWLIETWDVLKLYGIHSPSLLSSGLIETWDVLKSADYGIASTYGRD